MAGLTLENRYAHRLDNLHGSAIRDLLKQAGKENFISLGGGYPAPESFPIGIIKSIENTVSKKYGPNILQYGSTEGFKPLLDALPIFLSRKNRQVIASPENIVITAGSQQALDIIGRMFINPGDKIAVESPTYLGAVQAFNLSQAQYVEIKTDENGIIPENLEQAFIENPDIKFLYTIPTFQNPTGKTIPLDRRQKIAEILKKYNQLAVEDDPYSEIRYEGEDVPSLRSMAPENIIHLFTFSKTLAPDFRIGGMVAPKEITDKANLIKQGASLYTSNHDQAMVAEYLTGGYLDQHIPSIIALYKPRREAMVRAIEEYFPDIFDFNKPQGGLFVWSALKKEAMERADLYLLNMKKILEEAIKQNVGFVMGAPFFANSQGNEVAMRLNFSNQSEEKIIEGIRIIGEILHEKIRMQ